MAFSASLVAAVRPVPGSTPTDIDGQVRDQLLRCVEEHRGRPTADAEDLVMARFDGTVDAVECAVAMQAVVAATGIDLRAGIHAEEDAEPDGTPVVAEGLCDRAAAGEVLLSGAAWALSQSRLSYTGASRGQIRIPDADVPVEVWAIEPNPSPTAPRRIRIVVVDDQRLVRRGFQVILGAEPDLEVVGEAEDGDEALDVVQRLRPDVVLMDIRMPRVNGLDATKSILERTDARVIILTTFDADEYVYRALRMGASGFLLKDAPPERLITAVRCAFSGEALIDPAITHRLIAGFARPAAAPLPELTSREVDVLRLMAKGLSNNEIATSLFVEESTVKTHVARILSKLGARDRVQAVVRAFESGFVTTSD